jgi:hypothetical protein
MRTTKSRTSSPWLFSQAKLLSSFLECWDPFVPTPSISVLLTCPLLASSGTKYVATHLAKKQITACQAKPKGD